MSENADVPAVDLDRMTVPQLVALIAAAEAKRRDKLEDARAALRSEMERKAAEPIALAGAEAAARGRLARLFDEVAAAWQRV